MCHAVGHNIKTCLLRNDIINVESSTAKSQSSVGMKKPLHNDVMDVDSSSTKPQRPIGKTKPQRPIRMKGPRTRQQLRQYFGK